MTSSGEHVCAVCGESFSVQVWHCTNCDHHHGMDREQCNDCYATRESL